MPQRLSPLVTADVKSSIPPVHLCRHARCIAIYVYIDIDIDIDIIHFINKYRYSASEKVFEYIPIDLFNQGR